MERMKAAASKWRETMRRDEVNQFNVISSTCGEVVQISEVLEKKREWLWGDDDK